MKDSGHDWIAGMVHFIENAECPNCKIVGQHVLEINNGVSDLAKDGKEMNSYCLGCESIGIICWRPGTGCTLTMLQDAN